MKISKTPVREALQQLERDGFVENVPGRGCFVSRISFQDVKELFETREILECEVIRRAALKGDPEKIDGVRKKFELLESNGEKAPRANSKQVTAFTPISLNPSETTGSTRFTKGSWNTSRE